MLERDTRKEVERDHRAGRFIRNLGLATFLTASACFIGSHFTSCAIKHKMFSYKNYYDETRRELDYRNQIELRNRSGKITGIMVLGYVCYLYGKRKKRSYELR